MFDYSMKIFFLDVDGVFTSARTGWYNWDIYSVNFIRYCCEVSGAKVVISSTWRFNNNKEFFAGIFGDHLHEDWKTDNFPSKARNMDHIRGDEIKAWLDVHPQVVDYLIIDDDSDMLDDQKENHFVQTDSIDGMMFEHMVKIRAHFNIQSFPKGYQNLYQHPNMFEENYFRKYHNSTDPRIKFTGE